MSELAPYTGRIRNIEDAVMAGFQAGRPSEKIADELGLSPVTVRSIIGYLTPTLKDDWQADARRGSAALLVAIRRYQAAHGAAS